MIYVGEMGDFMFLNEVKKQLEEKQPLFIGEETAFRSAVLIPLVQMEGQWHILFEVRSFTMKKQPGDIGFPGGQIDPADQSPCEAVLREVHEELGVDPQTVEILGTLSPYIASPSFVIYPFVGVIDSNQIIPFYNKDEVEEVFTIPVKWLLTYEPYKHTVIFKAEPSVDFPFEKIMNGVAYQWRTRKTKELFFDYDKYTIWGITARILNHFIATIKSGLQI